MSKVMNVLIMNPTLQCQKCGYLFNLSKDSPSDVMEHKQGKCKKLNKKRIEGIKI